MKSGGVITLKFIDGAPEIDFGWTNLAASMIRQTCNNVRDNLFAENLVMVVPCLQADGPASCGSMIL